MNLVFDIETAALDQDSMPFLPECFSNQELPPMPEFTSRYTADVEKREADINEKIRVWKNTEYQKIIAKRTEFMDSAALSPDFGRIVAIGTVQSGPPEDIYKMEFAPDVSEKEMIENFLEKQQRTIKDGFRVAGFNSLGFDYPFLYWRSIILGVSHKLLSEAGIKFHPKWGLQLPGNCFDLMTIAQSRPMRGQRGEIKYDSMNQVCKALGLPEKLGDGKDFAGMTQEDKERYLQRDLECTHAMAKKMLPFW